ncbi:dihydrofolate reductase family protein [Cellulomonas cellasea]|uniref:dihydrofolate reductase family protein n=1 Tax=Cellulomonas cellasea TaxID=43670 RepID=UPI0027D97014|nr:dihydrofolate reductase family protein [Cellulomonas cellasea]
MVESRSSGTAAPACEARRAGPGPGQSRGAHVLERSVSAPRGEPPRTDSAGDVTIEGPTLAAHALRAGLVDGVHRVVVPVLVGGGTPLYPAGVHLDLELVDERRFDRGFVLLRCTARRADGAAPSSPAPDVCLRRPEGTGPYDGCVPPAGAGCRPVRSRSSAWSSSTAPS